MEDGFQITHIIPFKKDLGGLQFCYLEFNLVLLLQVL